jgi:acetolactate synthase-1/2/3 large subunit
MNSQNLGPSVAHALAAGLKRHGVTEVFGQSIPSVLHLVGPEFGIRQIAYRSENAGGAMADGYARISHKVAVITAQNGPAATLLVAPLAEALKASVPIVAIVQDVSRATVDRNAFQELDHISLFQACTKWVRRVDRADRVEDYLDMAFTAAATGRCGPAVLIVPMDLLREPAPMGGKRSASYGTYPMDPAIPTADRIAEAAQLLASAKRPLIMAGGGVHLSGAVAELVALSAALQIPVATTNMGKGAFDELSPLSAGVFGNAMGDGTLGKKLRHLCTDADVVLLVGTRTNQNGTDGWSLLPKAGNSARLIHIDADSMEIGRNYEALRLAGDAKFTLQRLLDQCNTLDLGARLKSATSVKEEIAAAKAAIASHPLHPEPGTVGSIRPEFLMRQIDARLSPDDIVTADASYATNWVAGFLTSKKAGMRFLTPRGLAGLGWGLPMAMGAKLARPGSRVISIVGDGGFAHCWSELETLRRERLDILVIVLHNRILGYQAHAENVMYGNHSSACMLTDVNHAAIAVACGCVGTRIDDPAQLAPALDTWFREGGPCLLDVSIDPAAYPPLGLYDGKDPMASAPLHIVV